MSNIRPEGKVAMALLGEIGREITNTLGQQVALPATSDRDFDASLEEFSKEMIKRCEMAEKMAPGDPIVEFTSNLQKAQVYGCWQKIQGMRSTHKNAIKCYERALELAGDNLKAEASVRYLYALMCGVAVAGAGGGRKKAIENFKRVIEIVGVDDELGIRCTKELEPLMKREREIRVQSYGPDAPEVAAALNDLAMLLYSTNSLSEAEPLMRRALEICEQSYGPNHPDVATTLNNLARLLQATNRLPEAEPLVRRALEIYERSYGPKHPNVATTLNNLAGLLQDTNRLPEAEPLVRRALEIHERSHGPDHPEVATALNNLAAVYYSTNRFSEAEPLYRRALQICEQSHGPDHPIVATALNNLALLLKAAGRLSEAEPLMRRMMEILITFTRASGRRHPELETVMNNYAGLLKAMGRSQDEILDHLWTLGPELFDV